MKIAGGGTCSLMLRFWLLTELRPTISGSNILRSLLIQRPQFWAVSVSHADCTWGNAQSRGIRAVMSRSFQKSCLKLKLSPL